MKRMSVSGLAGLSIALGLVVGGCGDEDGSLTGTLSLAIMDAPVDNAAQIWVTFTGVSLKPQGNGPAIDIDFPTPIEVDLLSLTADNAETLLDSYSVPAGFYNWLELHVSANHDGTYDSYAVLDTGETDEIEVIEVPSGRLRLVSGLTITADQETSFLIDWNLHEGLVDPVGRPGLFLRPALRVIDMTEYATLKGTVNAALVTPAPGCTGDLNLDEGHEVYIYEGLNATLDDFDTSDPQPVATAAVKQTPTGEYVYETLLSAPGDYTVAFTCRASDDEPSTDEAIDFVLPSDPMLAGGFTLEDGDTLTIDF